MKWTISRKATQYLFFELIPPFIVGLLVFIFILLMFQALRLTDFVLVHGVGVEVISKIIGFLSISFLPALLPMSLLFAIIMTYGRLSSDSEIVALKATGLPMFSILLPALLLSFLVTFLSAQTSFQLAPWGNRRFELIVNEIGQTKAGIALREGTFSEGFFDMVIYANKIDSKTGAMEKVFIYDERNGNTPLTVIAKHGEIIQDNSPAGNSVQLRLSEGDIHRKTENHTKINFKTFDIRLTDPVQQNAREKSSLSMSLDEIQEKLQGTSLNEDERRSLLTEFHKRWALALVCPLFALLGVGLSTSTNRRSQKSNGLILSLGVVIFYWVLYVSLEGLARSGQMPVIPAIWGPNILFALLSARVLSKNWN